MNLVTCCLLHVQNCGHLRGVRKMPPEAEVHAAEGREGVQLRVVLGQVLQGRPHDEAAHGVRQEGQVPEAPAAPVGGPAGTQSRPSQLSIHEDNNPDFNDVRTNLKRFRKRSFVTARRGAASPPGPSAAPSPQWARPCCSRSTATAGSSCLGTCPVHVEKDAGTPGRSLGELESETFRKI